MIDFACKEFKLDEIVKCGLGLTKVELEIFYYIIKQNDWVDSKSLSTTLRRDSSTVQRALKKFYENELVERKQINLDKGGYTFIYVTKNKKDIRQIIMNIIHKWVKKVDIELEKW